VSQAINARRRVLRRVLSQERALPGYTISGSLHSYHQADVASHLSEVLLDGVGVELLKVVPPQRRKAPKQSWSTGQYHNMGKNGEPHDLYYRLTASSGPENLLEVSLAYDHGC
jgi:hypothetical protein